MGDGWSRDEYPDDWDSRRKAVYARDGHTCQKCGAKGGPFGNNELHCHHIVPKSEGGSHAKSNLRTLCRDCHNKVHDHHIPKMSEVSSGGSSSPKSHRTVDTRASANLQQIAQEYESFEPLSETESSVSRSQNPVSTQTASMNKATSSTSSTSSTTTVSNADHDDVEASWIDVIVLASPWFVPWILVYTFTPSTLGRALLMLFLTWLGGLYVVDQIYGDKYE